MIGRHKHNTTGNEWKNKNKTMGNTVWRVKMKMVWYETGVTVYVFDFV